MDSLVETQWGGSPPGAKPPPPSLAVLVPFDASLMQLRAQFAQKFLELAGLLQSNSRRARELAAEAHRATGAETIALCQRSIERLQAILAEAAAVSRMVEVSSGRMGAILSQLQAVVVPLRLLTKLHTRLKIVSVLSRIEGGRLQGSEVDIAALASDIDHLATEVQTRVDGLFDTATSLLPMLTKGMKELDRLAAQGREHTAQLTRCAETVLQPAMVQLEASKSSAREIDEQFVDFQRATDRVIMSLQSEDLARQRVEHVQEALQRVRTTTNLGEDATASAGILALQRAQLCDTRDLLCESLQTIHKGLSALRPAVKSLVLRTTEQARQEASQGERLIPLIEEGTTSVSQTSRECFLSARSIVSLVDETVPAIASMTNGAGALQAIASSIHLLSLNATIKTAQLGTSGEAMSTLATELHAIIASNRPGIDAVLAGLDGIARALTEICSVRDGSGESSMLASESDHHLEQVLREFADTVRTSTAETDERLSTIEQMGEALEKDLRAGCELASHGEPIAEGFDKEIGSLDAAFESLGFTAEMIARNADRTRSEDLTAIYSMESERLLHAQIFGSATAETASPSSARDSVDLASDVELF